MVIDKIGALNNIQSAYQNQIRKNSGTEASSERKRSDRVESSSTGKERSELLKAVKEAVGKVETDAPKSRDEVRPEKVAVAKAKLENGTLVTDAVIDRIADRIVDSLGL